jgi:hypothetical protein
VARLDIPYLPQLEDLWQNFASLCGVATDLFRAQSGVGSNFPHSQVFSRKIQNPSYLNSALLNQKVEISCAHSRVSRRRAICL